MTPEPTKMRLLRASAFALIAVVAGALACETSPPDPGTEADAAAERAPTDPPSVTGESAVNPNYDVAPELQNPREVQERLQELYPDSLQQAGVGGTVVLWMYVDQDGRVRESRVKESDGPEAFEGPAREVVEAMEFDPALQGEEPTGVWVQQKVSFRVE